MATCSLHSCSLTAQSQGLAAESRLTPSNRCNQLIASRSAFEGVSSSFSTKRRMRKTLQSVSCSVCSPNFATSSTTKSSTLYHLLGIDQDVDFVEIKSAYRQMARRYHPDVCPSSQKEQSTEMFLQVHEAYEILSDPGRRAHYDYELMHPLCDAVTGDGSWRSRWQDQVSALKHRRRDNTRETWGSTMRSRSNCGHSSSHL